MTHALSINIYGRGDATLGDGPSHMGIALYTTPPQSNPGTEETICEMHHIRNPTDDKFTYDPRPQPLNDPVLRGRCEILSSLSGEDRSGISNLLTDFGNDETNIPEFGVGNCQDWVAGAVSMLEDAGVVGKGEGTFWRGMVNRSAEGMEEACRGSERVWIPGPESSFEGVPDASFNDKEVRSVGKLVGNEAFFKMQALIGTGTVSSDEGARERPFYVSSPFFGRMVLATCYKLDGNQARSTLTYIPQS
ncbi:hypothetical protein SI65_03369 [Aspergillus cristatus]|uniref:Uncharacterized protein n=1 Tax=Aspergillus cristatus TaxID=573508 RepID=A0A1E3BIV4_ASPCR|nr:hypothetical protein SI65_03369 [Aspergillus cristatus]